MIVDVVKFRKKNKIQTLKIELEKLELRKIEIIEELEELESN